MAALTVQTASLSGVTPTFNTCASGGDSFLNDGNVFVEVVNAHVSQSRTVTFAAASATLTHDGFGTVPVSNTAVTVAASTRKIIGPFPTARFNNSSGAVAVTYSDSAADLSMAVINLPQVQ
jgi:hypothetical protein